MPAQDWTLALDNLRRFDRPGPRYTSYPTAVEFHEGVGAEAYATALRRKRLVKESLNKRGDRRVELTRFAEEQAGPAWKAA